MPGTDGGGVSGRLPCSPWNRLLCLRGDRKTGKSWVVGVLFAGRAAIPFAGTVLANFEQLHVTGEGKRNSERQYNQGRPCPDQQREPGSYLDRHVEKLCQHDD